ncbi:MAG TPA: DUF4190 domain-containing protein [Streptosporangiaceae bacterium]
MALRFNPAPGWPAPPPGFAPSADWQPDPSWPPAPPGWQLWVDDGLQPAAVGQPGGAGLPGDTTRAFDAGGPSDTGGPSDAGQPGDAGRAGLGQPGAPGSSVAPWPAPGYGSAPGWYVPPPQGTNGLAIASFILGILGFSLIGLVLSIVFGIIALGRVRHSGQRGRGFAIAGLVLSGLWVVFYALILVATIHYGSAGSGASPGPSAAASGGTSVNVFSLVTGECFDNPTSSSASPQSVTSVVQTRCQQPHNAQIYATFKVQGSMLSYPGEAKLRATASSRCDALAKGSLDPAKLTDSEVIRYLYPLESSWLDGRRTVSCMVVSPANDVTSSLLK